MEISLLMKRKDAGIDIRVDLSAFWDDSLTNAEIAAATGLHPNTISKYRNGAPYPRVDVLMAFKFFFEKRLGRNIHLEEMIQTVDSQN